MQRTILIVTDAGCVAGGFVPYFSTAHPEYRVVCLDGEAATCTRRISEVPGASGVILFARSVESCNALLHAVVESLSEGKLRVHIVLPEAGHVQAEFYPGTPEPEQCAGKTRDFAPLLRSCNGLSGLEVTASVSSYVFGPGQGAMEVVPYTVCKALLGCPLFVPLQENDIRDLLFVMDYCRAIDRIFHAGEPGCLYGVEPDDCCSMLEITTHICKALDRLRPREDNRSYADLIQTSPDVPGRDARRHLEAKPYDREFGRVCKIGMKAGLLETVAWCLLHEEELLRKFRSALKTKERRYVKLMSAFFPRARAGRSFLHRHLWQGVCTHPLPVAAVINAAVRFVSFFVSPSAKRKAFRKKHKAVRLSLTAGYKRGCCVRDMAARFVGRFFPDKRSRRILVVLHLYYMDAWPEIRSYLETLAPFRYDLIVTYTDTYTQSVLDQVRAFKGDTRFIYCQNRGFDIAPFLEAIADVDLDGYDVVYKLHSKGVRRSFIYVYDQIFKDRDWFLNLFNGLFGLFRTRKVVDLLSAPDTKTGLVAAENLIVQDPPHKRRFTMKIAREVGLPVDEDYWFVAGTCFAIRAPLLKPVQSLGLHLADFAPAKSGVFSLAHGMERIVCACVASQGYTYEGLPVCRNRHSLKVRRFRKKSALRLLSDPRFNVDDEFFYKNLETRQVRRYEVVKIRLGDIRREWFGTMYKLKDCAPFRYLQGDTAAYDRYCKENMLKSTMKVQMTPERFDTLLKSIDEHSFDARNMPVVDGNNSILDGQHRCCILLHKYGEVYEINVLKLYM